MLQNEHLQAVEFFSEQTHPTEGPIRVVVNPSKWSESQPEFQRHAPRLGQHSREILSELGLADDDIQSLADANVTMLAH